MGGGRPLRYRGCVGYPPDPSADHLHHWFFRNWRDIVRDFFRRDGSNLSALLDNDGLNFLSKNRDYLPNRLQILNT